MIFYDKFKKVKKFFSTSFNFTINSKINIDNISTIQSCVRILVENVSRLPIIVKDGEGNIIENHPISKLFNNKFNDYLTSDKARKIIERDRVVNGNGFGKIIFDNNGNLKSIIPIVYDAVDNIQLKNNNLYYTVNHAINPYSSDNRKEIINGNDILHFTSSIIDGYIGVSPIQSLVFESEIRSRASETLINFYKNNAMNPLVLSSNISDLSQVKALKEFTDNFELENAGSENAGKIIKLNPGMRIDTLNYKLADAELINTLKFTNEQIISAFGIPSFLMSYETTQSIENQTLEFKTFTLNSILFTYINELESKMLLGSEIDKGYYIEVDYTSLLDADIRTKADAYQKLASNGLISINEAIQLLGLGKKIKNSNGDKHYLQMQYVAIEDNINMIKEEENDKNKKRSNKRS